MKVLNEIAGRAWMSIYLKIIAVFLAFGALTHMGNMLGFGEEPFKDFPLSWKIADIYFAILNVIAVIGLWKMKGWGILAFFIAMASQFVIYSIFIDYFAFTSEHHQAIKALLVIESILIGIFVLLSLMKK